MGLMWDSLSRRGGGGSVYEKGASPTLSHTQTARDCIAVTETGADVTGNAPHAAAERGGERSVALCSGDRKSI